MSYWVSMGSKTNQMTMKTTNIILSAFAAMCLAVSLTSCDNGKKYSQAEVDAMVKKAVAESKAEENKTATRDASAEVQQDNSVETPAAETQSSTNNTSSASSAKKELAYKAGYDLGMSRHTTSLEFCTRDNEKHLKDEYMFDCRNELHGLKKEDYNNRELYNEYRRGFMKGYEDGNNAL